MTEDNKQDIEFPSGGSRTEYIGAKVTAEQKQYIRRLAAECGMTVSSYVLARAFNYRPKARLTARQEAVMETLIGCRTVRYHDFCQAGTVGKSLLSDTRHAVRYRD